MCVLCVSHINMRFVAAVNLDGNRHDNPTLCAAHSICRTQTLCWNVRVFFNRFQGHRHRTLCKCKTTCYFSQEFTPDYIVDRFRAETRRVSINSFRNHTNHDGDTSLFVAFRHFSIVAWCNLYIAEHTEGDSECGACEIRRVTTHRPQLRGNIHTIRDSL